MNSKPLILLIEDEQQIRRFLRASLADDFDMIESAGGIDGLNKFGESSPRLVLLDLGLPDIHGIEVIAQLRKRSNVPIIILSAHDAEQTKIQALERGADDYVTKPFTMGELIARIRAALRRANSSPELQPPGQFTINNLQIDINARVIKKNGQDVHLTPIEFGLLSVLAQNAGKVVTHNHLLNSVWGTEFASQTQYVRVYMGQLRHKLEDNPARPKFILTEPGVGYRLKVQ